MFTAAGFYLCAKKHKLKVDKNKLIELAGTSEDEFSSVSTSMKDLCHDVFGVTKEKKDPKSVKGNSDFHVLSVCWCGDLSRSAFSSGGIQNLQLHSNELVSEGLLSTGEIKKVESPIDKLQTYKAILKEHNQVDRKNLTIYIGDSIGDLLCLLNADIAIVIGSSSSLRRIGTHFGVSLIPLFPGLVMKQREHAEGSDFSWNRLSGAVYTVSSWAEIHSFIVGS